MDIALRQWQKMSSISKYLIDLVLLHNGFYDLYSDLDQASMRMGGDFGITDNLNIGLGRSTVEKTYDGFIKYKFLKQSDGSKIQPPNCVLLLAT